MPRRLTAPVFLFDAGLLCLDFVNTRSMHDGRLVDRLRGFEDVVAWLRAAGVLTKEGRRAAGLVADRPRARQEVFAAALRLREDLDRFVRAALAGQAPRAALAATVNRILAASPSVPAVVLRNGRFAAGQRSTATHPLALLLPVAGSARDLFVDGRPDRIRRCDDPACVIVFHDTTRNHSRRWCSMARCGNRAKAAAHYRRARRPVRGTTRPSSRSTP